MTRYDIIRPQYRSVPIRSALRLNKSMGAFIKF